MDGVGHIYKVLGNAVVPSVIEAIGREILRLMDEVEAAKKMKKEKRKDGNGNN